MDAARNGVNQALADLLHATGEAHHQAFKETDGADPDWAIWYAPYLLAHGIEKMLDASILRSDLTYLLVLADKTQMAEAPGAHWERWYADFLIRRYLR